MEPGPQQDWIGLQLGGFQAGFGLQTSRTSERLNQIDQVRANGVGNHISLPQLVVCGDQSAGKSSVLERITGIPFPRQDGFCTRFPTEIIIRHDPAQSQATATIIPHQSRAKVRRSRLRNFRRQIESFDDLPNVIHDAAQLMGIRGHATQSEDAPAFSKDVLRLEIVGNTCLHLTIVDLPGLISVSENEQDVQLVHDLVDTYLESSRTIILAVVPASSDVDTQGIIQRARRFDRDGDRTVGIITKPDLINQGTESRVARLAKNIDKTKLKLGFFLLKNPSPVELEQGIGLAEHHKAEIDFFSSGPWKREALDRSRIGVEKLRSFLQDLLDSHIEGELPKVREDTRSLLRTVDDELADIGTERSSPDQIRLYLMRISNDFHTLVRDGLEGAYSDTFFQGHDDEEDLTLRLRAAVHKVNQKFANYMRQYGRKHRIVADMCNGPAAAVGDQSESDEEQSEPPAGPRAEVEDQSESDEDQSEDHCQEGQVLVTEGEMSAWVQKVGLSTLRGIVAANTYIKVYNQTRGQELPGSHNQSFLRELFHVESSCWESIARKHLRQTVFLVYRFTSSVLEFVIKDPIAQQRLHQEITRTLEHNTQKADQELEKLLADEARQPITYNHYYTDNIQKARHDRAKKQVEDALNGTLKRDLKGRFVFGSGELASMLANLQKRVMTDMTEQACSEARTDLDAYYKVFAAAVN
jgi:GTP-binding protein EngB required for normal cell division